MPTGGNPEARPAVRYRVADLDKLTVDNVNLGFSAATNAVLLTRTTRMSTIHPDIGIADQFIHGGQWSNSPRSAGASDGVTSSTANDADDATIFPLIGSDISIPSPALPGRWGLNAAEDYEELRTSAPSTIVFDGGTIRISIMPGAGNSLQDPVQEIEVELPRTTIPVPLIVRPLFKSDLADFETGGSFNPKTTDRKTAAFYSGINGAAADGRDFNQRLSANRVSPWDGGLTGAVHSACRIRRGDVIRSVILDPAGLNGADPRIIASLREVSSNHFTKAPSYDDSSVLQACVGVGRSSGINYRRSVAFGNTALGNNPESWIRPDNRDTTPLLGKLAASLSYGQWTGNQPRPSVPPGLNGALMAPNVAGDWNTGIGAVMDGGYVNIAEQGFAAGDLEHYNIYFPSNPGDQTSQASLTSFSPNPQVFSPVLLGSIPSGVDPSATFTSSGTQQPWRTLLFCPNPAAGNNHPGFGAVGVGPSARPPFAGAPDHLFLDLFWMPVVEPFAISDSFSTAGKVNMNTRLAPFGHIRRETALHAALKAVKIPALPDALSGKHKSEQAYLPKSTDGTFGPNPSWRYNIDVEAVLAGMKNLLGGTDLFRSASEICSVFMVPSRQPGSPSSPAGPAGSTPLERYNNTAAWWNDKKLSGDNVREAPYDAIYSRITTKSNTFTVHYRVQALKQVTANRTSAADWEQWREGRDQVISEFRGRTMIERRVDPADTTVPDFAAAANDSLNLAPYYRWRTLEQKQFRP